MLTELLGIAGAFIFGFLLAASTALLLVHALFDIYREERATWTNEREGAVVERAAMLGRAEDERRELWNRIQHPQLVPTGRRSAPRIDPDELQRRREAAAEMSRVGTVVPAADNGDLPGVP